MANNRFLPAYHIRTQADFRRAYRRGCTTSDGLLRVFGCANGLPYCRIGLSVSRTIGKAVIRNRWKRLIREAFRLRQEQLPVGIDLVILPRPTAEPTLAALLDSLPRLATQIARRLNH
jgi:ribonuclease P protein component